MNIYLWLLAGVISYCAWMYYGEYRDWRKEEVTLFTFIKRLPIIALGFTGVFVCLLCGITRLYDWFSDWTSGIVFWDSKRFDKKSKGGK